MRQVFKMVNTSTGETAIIKEESIKTICGLTNHYILFIIPLNGDPKVMFESRDYQNIANIAVKLICTGEW